MKRLMRLAILISSAAVTGCSSQRPPAQARLAAPVQPVDHMVLVGMAETKSAKTAFIENIDTHEVSGVNLGDQIAGGKVTAVSVDGIDYLRSGSTRRLSTGQNLSGVQLYGDGAAPWKDKPEAQRFASPNGDMLMKLAKRRIQELNDAGQHPDGGN